jgi:hypothetical protein
MDFHICIRTATGAHDIMRCSNTTEKLYADRCLVSRIFIDIRFIPQDPGHRRSPVIMEKADINISGTAFPDRLIDGTILKVRPGFVIERIIVDQV